jgi:hypothetical protein
MGGQLNHFDNAANGSIASTSTLNKIDQHLNNGKAAEVPAKVLMPSNGVLANNTNKADPVIGTKYDEKLEKMRWFHGLMTRDNAERILVRDGDYLVRETNKAERQYVLSGKYKGECRHIFLVDPSGVVS